MCQYIPEQIFVRVVDKVIKELMSFSVMRYYEASSEVKKALSAV